MGQISPCSQSQFTGSHEGEESNEQLSVLVWGLHQSITQYGQDLGGYQEAWVVGTESPAVHTLQCQPAPCVALLPEDPGLLVTGVGV